MGTIKFGSVADSARHGADLKVGCSPCRQSADFSAREIVNYFTAMAWNDAFGVCRARFRCQVCGGPASALRRVEGRLPIKPRPVRLATQQR